MVARRYELLAPHPWRDLALLLAAVVGLSLLGAWGWVHENPDTGWLGAWVAWFLLLGATGGATFARRMRDLRRPPPRFIEVGVDGVLAGERFIPYADISSVEHGRRARTEHVPTLGGGEAEQTTYAWTVSILLGGVAGDGVLLEGEAVDLVTSRAASDDRLGAEIARAIDGGLRAWNAARRREGLDRDLARRDRTGPQWVEALRRRGAGATAYRDAAADLERASRLLDDPQAKPSARAAAAVVLAASGDPTAAPKLRVAAGAMVDARVRIALENVADEAAVAEALEALEALEEGQPASEGASKRRAHGAGGGAP